MDPPKKKRTITSATHDHRHSFNSHSRSHTHTHSSSFLLHNNGFPTATKLEISDIEMIAFQSVAYTSLRDLMPTSSSSPAAATAAAIVSPTNNSSWYELPIKNPLVKQAALAYLQPMSTPPEVGPKGLLSKLKGDCNCFCWLGDFISRAVRDAFGCFFCEDDGGGCGGEMGVAVDYGEDDEEEEDTEKLD